MSIHNKKLTDTNIELAKAKVLLQHIIDTLGDRINSAIVAQAMMEWGEHLGDVGAEVYYWYKPENEKIKFFIEWLDTWKKDNIALFDKCA